MKKSKLISLILVTTLIFGMLSGCNSGGATVMKINGNSISADIFKAAIAQNDMSFQQSYGASMLDYLDEEISEGVTGEQKIKEDAAMMIKQMEAFRMIAEENGISITDADKEELKSQKDATVQSMGGRKAFLDELANAGNNEIFFDYMMDGQILATKVQSLFAEGGKYAVTPDIAVELLSSGYARVKHVLVLAEEGAANYAEKKALAEQIATRAAAGEDFEALIKEYGEDPGMETYADGYIIDQDGYTLDASGSQMIAEFTEASHALAENGVSAVVPSNYGFHIIKRYTLSKEYVTANFQNYAGDITSTLYMDLIAKAIAEMSVTTTPEYDTFDVRKVLQDLKVKQEQAARQQ